MDEPTELLPPVSTRSLDEILRQRGALSVEQAMPLLSAIAHALVKVIEAKGASQPLMAQNIRVAGLDEGKPAVILTESEGTLDLSPGADSYSLGIIAFTALVGRPPRLDEALADALPSVPAAVDRLVAKLLSRMPAERPAPAQAQRQFDDLSRTLSEPSVRAAAPLTAPPQIKRGPPIGDLRTDAKAWALRPDGKPDTKKTQPVNPFDDDEATATVQGPITHDTDGDDESTELGGSGLSATYRKAGYRTGDRAPLAPPVPTPSPTPAATPAVTGELFEATKGDLMGRTLDAPADPKVAPRRVTRAKPSTPLEQLVALARRQPPWVWGAMGVALAFLVLVLIALTR